MSHTPSPEDTLAPKAKTMLALGMTLFAAFLLASTVSFVVYRNSIRTAILENELPLSSDNVYSEIQRDLFEPILISSLMANDTFLRDWITEGEQDPEVVMRYLRRIQEQYNTITAFLVAEASETYYHPTAAPRKVRPDQPIDRWFFRVRMLPAPYEINIDPDLANRNTMTIFINYRIVDEAGNFIGATGVGLSVSAVKSLIQEYHQRFGRDVFFYNRQGELVLHRLEEGNAPELLAAHLHLGDDLQPLLAQIEEGHTEITLSREGRAGVLANYRYIPELDWILLVEQSSDGTRPVFLRSFGFNMVVCLITAAILLLFIRRTSMRYSKSLESRNQELSAQKRRIEEQAAALDSKNEELSRLLQILCHDLANPIAAVKGILDMGDEGNALILELRGEIDSAINQAHDMIHLVGKLHGIEAGRYDLGITDVSLADALATAANCARQRFADKEVTLNLDIPPDLVVRAEPTSLINSVIANLLTNAVKFSPRGSTVSVAARYDAKQQRVIVTVSDQGVGMPKALVDTVFTPGRKPSHPGTEGELGTGFGLPLVKRFVTAYGGTVTITSRELAAHPTSSGTTVTLLLPGHPGP